MLKVNTSRQVVYSIINKFRAAYIYIHEKVNKEYEKKREKIKSLK
jgi:hypothetical protein